MTRYIVKWGKQGRKYQFSRIFDFRENAIVYLNHLILDLGIYDAKLTAEYRK